MSAETEDPDLAARRLEAALERIARLAERLGDPANQPDGGDHGYPHDPRIPKVAARLDSLIARLRAALAESA